MVAFVQTPTATKARDRYRQSCLVGRLADNIGLRIRFDAGVDMLGGVRRNCTYVTRVLGLTALPATRSPPNFANEKNPGTLPGVFVAFEEICQAASCAFRFLRQRP